MPRKKNLDIAEALGEDIDVTEEESMDANTIIPAAPAPVVPAPALSMTASDIQAIVRAAVEAAQGGNQELAQAITTGIQQSAGKHENETHPGVSVYNPAGERDHPRPGLKCRMTLGIRDPKTQVVSETYALDGDDLTAYEQIALNTLEPWEGKIELLDGTVIPLTIVPSYNDVTEALERLVLVLPQAVTGKGSEKKNMVPSIPSIVAQVTGRDFSRLSLDDLKWFMAEHRSGRYVSERSAVAA
jgi:hypothetical protein